MELLKELNEKDIGIGSSERFDKPYVLRKAARAVLFNDRNEIAILNVNKKNYHKLPGGGMNQGESLEECLRREILEETGCSIRIRQDIGTIIEYRNKKDELQISYCYAADVERMNGEPEYEKEEIEDGFELMWVNIDDAIELLESDNPESYSGKFIIIRDLIFLKKAKE